jgi:hypothetical protein
MGHWVLRGVLMHGRLVHPNAAAITETEVTQVQVVIV